MYRLLDWISRVEVADPLRLLAALGLLYVFGCGMALLSCLIATSYGEVQKIIPMILRPLYFISGIFFALSNIPSDYRIYFLWNPMLHALELIRDACFASFETVGGSWLYLSLFSVSVLCLGLALYRQNANHLLRP